MIRPLRNGKLPGSLLADLIELLPTQAPGVIVPPGPGCDAGCIKINDNLVAVTTDPITFASDKLGTYSVSININDIACMGCRPCWYTSTLLLPEGSTENQVREIWQDLVNALKKYDIIAIGGHCEVTPAVNQPVLIGQMLGEPLTDHVLEPKNIQIGDKILLWQSLAIEGSALLATERFQELQSHLEQQQLLEAKKLIEQPGICVWPFVEKLAPFTDIVALHDPTEGGIATALHELADATKYGLQIHYEKLSFLPITKKLADIFQFDPLGFLASGSLLVVCKKSQAEKLLEKFPNEPLSLVGEFTQSPERLLLKDNAITKLPRFACDELINAFEYQL